MTEKKPESLIWGHVSQKLKDLYTDHRAYSILSLSKWAMPALVVILSIFTVIDIKYTGLPVYWFRLPATLISIVLFYLSMSKSKIPSKWVINIFVLLEISLMTMMYGLLLFYAMDPPEFFGPGWNGLIIATFGTFILSAGGAKEYSIIYGISFLLFSIAQHILGIPYDKIWILLINSFPLMVGAIIISQQIEKLRARSFFAGKEIERNLQIIENDIALAGKLQKGILPQDSVYQSDQIDVHSIYMPMQKVGGDFFDFLKYSSHDYALFIADVCGHGVQAAMVASMIKIALHSGTPKYGNPEYMIRKVHSELYKKIGDSFFTAGYIHLDLKNKKAKIVSAGHMPLLVINRKNPRHTIYQPAGKPLGISETIDIEVEEFNINEGDRLLFYTDGLTDSLDHDDINNAIIKLKDLVLKRINLKPEEACNHLIGEINKEQLNPIDDLTMVMVDINNFNCTN